MDHIHQVNLTRRYGLKVGTELEVKRILVGMAYLESLNLRI